MTNLEKINEAIATSDLIFIGNELAKPFSIDGDELLYMSLVTDDNCVCNINEFEIKTYEEGIV